MAFAKTPSDPIRGRGASTAPAHRFSKIDIEPDPEQTEESISPKTCFYNDDSSKIISSNDSPDIPFEKSINPYRGCEHGCIYCYARPFHEFLDFSPGLDFETRIMVKKNAAQLLKKELSHPGWHPRSISVSGVTDPYQPIERKMGITRQCLSVLADFRNPFTIVTKNYLVTRDIDILKTMASIDAARVMISLTSMSSDLIQRLEPRTSRPQKRLKAIRELSKAGIPVGVLFAPVIPGLNDDELPELIKEASDAGAQFGNFVMLRLPGSNSFLFEQWLNQHYPDRKKKIMNRILSIRNGHLNDNRYGHRMKGNGAFADQIRQIFQISCKKHHLSTESAKLSTSHFRRVPSQGELDFSDH